MIVEWLFLTLLLDVLPLQVLTPALQVLGQTTVPLFRVFVILFFVRQRQEEVDIGFSSFDNSSSFPEVHNFWTTTVRDKICEMY